LLNVSDMTSTFKLAALVLLCAMGLACIEGDYPDSGAPVLAGQTVEAERFLGSWRQVAGEYGRLCEGATLEHGDVPPDRIAFHAGDVPDEVIARSSDGCEVICAVQGKIARGRPGANCGAGVTISALHYQLDGNALRETTSYVESSDGRRCSVLADGVLVRE
jgi:hypothetical protein